MIVVGKYGGGFTAILFVTFAIHAACTTVFKRLRTRYPRRVNALEAESNARGVDRLLNVDTVKYFAREDVERDRLERVLDAWREAGVDNPYAPSTLHIGQSACIGAGIAAVMLLDDLWRARRADWPALLVCDIDLGDDEEDGYAVMSRIRQIDAARDREGRAPLEGVALSGHARERDRTPAVEAGFHAYLTKPAATADLIATLRALAFSSGETHVPPATRSADRPPRR